MAMPEAKNLCATCCWSRSLRYRCSASSRPMLGIINAILYQLLLLVPQKPAKLFCAVTIDPKISSHGFLIFHPYLRNKEGFLWPSIRIEACSFLSWDTIVFPFPPCITTASTSTCRFYKTRFEITKPFPWPTKIYVGTNFFCCCF